MKWENVFLELNQIFLRNNAVRETSISITTFYSPFCWFESHFDILWIFCSWNGKIKMFVWENRSWEIIDSSLIHTLAIILIDTHNLWKFSSNCLQILEQKGNLNLNPVGSPDHHITSWSLPHHLTSPHDHHHLMIIITSPLDHYHITSWFSILSMIILFWRNPSNVKLPLLQSGHYLPL